MNTKTTINDKMVYINTARLGEMSNISPSTLGNIAKLVFSIFPSVDGDK